ncbi:HNH endonuclease [Acinetobacter phage Presley]|uniref:Metallopeptidase n=1 Tax=Acinetobacter phage Presley TaxID=1406780 RepID=U5PVT3_9CAUD|nr:HNH endonuclease [Acinetobacter phage Presley]AGY48100.1 hypothetical protein Presley_33 [Acinetobacter phage Presley]
MTDPIEEKKQGIHDVDPDIKDRANQKILMSKTALLNRSDFTFFSSILLKLKIILDMRIPTACTDGRTIRFNPVFLEDYDQKETTFIMMHELMHVVYKHLGRVNGRDHKMWNVACDYVINGQLTKLGFKRPKTALFDTRFNDRTADDVYFELFQDAMANPSKPRPEPDHNDIGEDLTDQQLEDLNEAIDDLIVSGTVAAQNAGNDAAGNIPGELLRRYQELTNPTVPWEKLLRNFLEGRAKNDFSMARPSRRHLAHGMYLPSLYSENLEQIDFAIDVSGSVDEIMLEKFISEVAGIFKAFTPECIGVYQFDHELKKHDVVYSLEDFKKITYNGGGGTDVLPVLDYYRENQAKALVIITDGYFCHDKSWDPRKPVIWVVYDNPTWKPHFGEVAHFDIDKFMGR